MFCDYRTARKSDSFGVSDYRPPYEKISMKVNRHDDQNSGFGTKLSERFCYLSHEDFCAFLSLELKKVLD